MHMRFLTLLSTALLFWSAGPAMADNAADDPRFGIYGQYENVSPPQATETPGKVEVVELFWYGCPHCYSFEPYIKKWLETKPDHVGFRRAPAIFRKDWIPQAKAYYTAEQLGVLEAVHLPLFKAIHDQKRPLNTKEQLADFFAEQGVERAAFDKTYDSFAVQSKVQRAYVMTQRYGIQGVPAVVVNGKYRTTGSLTGSYDNLVKVINILVDEEHRAMGTVTATTDGSAARPN